MYKVFKLVPIVFVSVLGFSLKVSAALPYSDLGSIIWDTDACEQTHDTQTAGLVRQLGSDYGFYASRAFAYAASLPEHEALESRTRLAHATSSALGAAGSIGLASGLIIHFWGAGQIYIGVSRSIQGAAVSLLSWGGARYNGLKYPLTGKSVSPELGRAIEQVKTLAVQGVSVARAAHVSAVQAARSAHTAFFNWRNSMSFREFEVLFTNNKTLQEKTLQEILDEYPIMKTFYDTRMQESVTAVQLAEAYVAEWIQGAMVISTVAGVGTGVLTYSTPAPVPGIESEYMIGLSSLQLVNYLKAREELNYTLQYAREQARLLERLSSVRLSLMSEDLYQNNGTGFFGPVKDWLHGVTGGKDHDLASWSLENVKVNYEMYSGLARHVEALLRVLCMEVP